jgi:hypothetical protein
MSQHANLLTYNINFIYCAGNPPFVYGSNRDRELPELVAPGVTSDTIPGIPMTNPCLDQAWVGTSFSAPTLSGICANVRSANSQLNPWPEAVRAIVVLTAHNADGTQWDVAVDDRDGTGTVSGQDAEQFARNYIRVAPGHTNPVTNGLAFVKEWDTSATYHYYRIQAPQTLPSNKHLRVVLNWDSRPQIATSTNHLTDLDIGMWVNGVFYSSMSDNDNYEVIDVPNTAITPGNYYQVMLAKVVNRFPAAAGSKYTFYSLVWSWVRDHAN